MQLAGPPPMQMGFVNSNNMAAMPQPPPANWNPVNFQPGYIQPMDPSGQQGAGMHANQAAVVPSNVALANPYLINAFRVGLLALETLSRRVHDDRPQIKYARNPPYGEDVKWLLSVAIKLGETLPSTSKLFSTFCINFNFFKSDRCNEFSLNVSK